MSSKVKPYRNCSKTPPPIDIAALWAALTWPLDHLESEIYTRVCMRNFAIESIHLLHGKFADKMNWVTESATLVKYVGNVMRLAEIQKVGSNACGNSRLSSHHHFESFASSVLYNSVQYEMSVNHNATGKHNILGANTLAIRINSGTGTSREKVRRMVAYWWNYAAK